MKIPLTLWAMIGSSRIIAAPAMKFGQIQLGEFILLITFLASVLSLSIRRSPLQASFSFVIAIVSVVVLVELRVRSIKPTDGGSNWSLPFPAVVPVISEPEA